MMRLDPTPITTRNIQPHDFKSPTLADLERTAHNIITAAANLANAARAADSLGDDASVALRIGAVVELDAQLAALDEARWRAAQLVRVARIELGR